MCKDGKCLERADQTRNVIVSMGIAARELSKLAEHPHMVVKTATTISFVMADPSIVDAPGVAVIMEVYPTTTDAEVGEKADRYMTQPPRRVLSLIDMLAELFESPPALGSMNDRERETLHAAQTSARIAERTARQGF